MRQRPLNSTESGGVAVYASNYYVATDVAKGRMSALKGSHSSSAEQPCATVV
jgi:hypothetical protein